MVSSKHLIALLMLVMSAILIHGTSDAFTTYDVEDIFSEIGFSSACVAQSLAVCENSSEGCSNLPISNQLKIMSENNIVQKSHIEGIKFQLKSLQTKHSHFQTETEIQIRSIHDKLDDILQFLHHLNTTHSKTLLSSESTFGAATEAPHERTNVSSELPTPSKRGQNCADLRHQGSGIRTVYPDNSSESVEFSVLCDQTTDGGGWTVIQHRGVFPQRIEFFRNWDDYARGFGNLKQEFWLGLTNIHALVKDTNMELRVDLEDFKGEKKWAKYDHFYVEGDSGKYRLHLGVYEGTAGNSFGAHDGMLFSTKDQDNDKDEDYSCAARFRSGWWFMSCYQANLNGFGSNDSNYTQFDGITWVHFNRKQGYHLKTATMMIRPSNRK